MKLYNQIDKALCWDIGGEVFECEPFGAVDIPEEYVEPCKSRGVPLGPAPKAPEERAHIEAERALQEAAGAEVLKLKEALAIAEANLATTTQTLEREMGISNKLKSKCDALEAKVRELNGTIERGKKDYAALEVKVLELAEQVAEYKSQDKRKPRGKQEA